MIKTVLWDVDGTLLDFGAAERAAIRTLFKEFGFGECTDDMLSRYSEINAGFWLMLERGEISKPRLLVERMERFFGEYGIDKSTAPRFNERYQSALGDTIVYLDDSINVVKALKGRVSQYAVSNGTVAAQTKKLELSKLGGLMDGVFLSEKLGAEKPDSRFFEKVLSEIREGDLSEVIIVGDSLTSDILGGMNAGIKTCWYDPGRKPVPEGYRVDHVISDLHELAEILDSENSRLAPDPEIGSVFSLFFDGAPFSVKAIDSSRGEADLRKTFIIETADGTKRVIKLASNDFTFPEKIRMWARTVDEYRALGYYCPRIFADRAGGYPTVKYRGVEYVAYAEEYSEYGAFESRTDLGEDESMADNRRYAREIWSMTARIAAKRLDYTEYPSAYCLFETFCPSDKTDEVLDNALEWKATVDALPEEFSERARRIWELWLANREALERIYPSLPTSVFQADLNSSNLLVDKDGRFMGVYDFNLCGKDVFLNYLIRECSGVDGIREALKISAEYYTFSEEEKAAALPLYRCLTPLWWDRVQDLKEAGSDREAIDRCLRRAEDALTEDTDLAGYME